jgi:hypothetical protein
MVGALRTLRGIAAAFKTLITDFKSQLQAARL